MNHASVNTRIVLTVGVLCTVLTYSSSWAAVLKRHLPAVEAQENTKPVDLDMLLPFQHMDPVDVCLFKCNDCYQVSNGNNCGINFTQLVMMAQNCFFVFCMCLKKYKI